MARKHGQRVTRSFVEPMKHLHACHRDIRHFLVLIAEVLRRTAGGALTPAQWSQLAVSIVYFETAGVAHTADEEESLFPRLRAARDAMRSQ